VGGLAVIKTVGEWELISPLIGKARALSNFRLEGESFGLRLAFGFRRIRPSGKDREQDRLLRARCRTPRAIVGR